MGDDKSSDAMSLAKVANVPSSVLDEDLLRRRLANLADGDNSADAVAAFISMAFMARAHGLLYLERFFDDIKDPLMRTLLQLVTDGTEPDVVRQTADNHVSAALRRRQGYREIIRQGIFSIQCGHNPRLVSELLNSVLGVRPPEWVRSSILETRPSSLEVLSQEEIDSLLSSISLSELDVVPPSGEFERIVLVLSDRDIQQLIRELDGKELGLALKGTTQDVLTKIFRNLSLRGSQMLHEDIRFMGPVRVKDVQDAKDRILATVYKLAESGDVVIDYNGVIR